MVSLKQLDFCSLSIRESQTLNEGEKSTEVKSTEVESKIVSIPFTSLVLEKDNLSHEVQKNITIRKVKMRKNINLFKTTIY